MWAWLVKTGVGLLMGSSSALVKSVGGIIVDYHNTTAQQQGQQDADGAKLAAGWLSNISETNRIKAESRAAEGKWGPTGILAFSIGSIFAFHALFVVLDSNPFHPGVGMHWGFVPWLEWQPHKVGSWKVATLPGLFEATEHAVLQSFFYIGGAIAGVSTLAKSFRR